MKSSFSTSVIAALLDGRSGKFPSGLICFAVLCITLSLGLWPFHSPINQVKWLSVVDGVEYGRSGAILSSSEFEASNFGNSSGHTIEIWTEPSPYQRSATLFSLYDPQSTYLLNVRQSLTDLRLEVGSSNIGMTAALTVPEVFRRATPSFISIISGREGTTIYKDGAFAGKDPNLKIPGRAFAGRFILGDSPLQPDSWRGKIFGLAIYGTELTESQTSRHYKTWTQSRKPEIAANEGASALYLFNEHKGSAVHNLVRTGDDLYIPDRYEVVDKIFMEPIWREFKMSRSYWSAVLKNVVGFLPLGFCFYSFFLARRPQQPVGLTVAAGIVVSVAIEVLQWFLPTRDSGTTDIFTNALGTWGGVWLNRYINPILAERFPTLDLGGRLGPAVNAIQNPRISETSLR